MVKNESKNKKRNELSNLAKLSVGDDSQSSDLQKVQKCQKSSAEMFFVV